MNKLNTLFIGKVLKSFKNLPSTNVYALNLIAKSKPIEGTVIMAANQMMGRGQRDTVWESESDKNILLSIILFPTFLQPKNQFLLNEIISLGMIDLLKKYFGNRVSIKWPNDIYVNDKKIAGILIQNSITFTAISSSVIGLGFNVNQNNFPTNIPNPTSMALEREHQYNLEKLSFELLEMIEARYLQLKSGKTEKIRNEYIQNLFRIGKKASFAKQTGEIIEGSIIGINESGQLLIKTLDIVQAFSFKEIKFLL